MLPDRDRAGVAFALEGCTGWRYVAEELTRAEIGVHVAEPAETAARRGPKPISMTSPSTCLKIRYCIRSDTAAVILNRR
jgi:transposase